MDFIRLYGFGGSILIFVKYALVQAQQKRCRAETMQHSDTKFSLNNQCRLPTYFFYIHSKNFTELTYYYSFSFLILSSGSSLATIISEFLYWKTPLEDKLQCFGRSRPGQEYHYMGLQFNNTEVWGNWFSHIKGRTPNNMLSGGLLVEVEGICFGQEAVNGIMTQTVNGPQEKQCRGSAHRAALWTSLLRHSNLLPWCSPAIGRALQPSFPAVLSGEMVVKTWGWPRRLWGNRSQWPYSLGMGALP